MKFDPRAKQIIEMFSDPKSYSPLMEYDSTFVIDTKTAAKEYYKRVKHLEHRVEKRKYYDSALNEKYEAWYITVKLKHSIIDAFFFPIGNKTRVIILRKDKPYITVALGAATIIAIILFGNMFISLTLNARVLLENFIIGSILVGGTLFAVEKIALPDEIKKIIRDFDAEMMKYREETIDETELQKETKIKDASKELEEL